MNQHVRSYLWGGAILTLLNWRRAKRGESQIEPWAQSFDWCSECDGDGCRSCNDRGYVMTGETT